MKPGIIHIKKRESQVLFRRFAIFLLVFFTSMQIDAQRMWDYNTKLHPVPNLDNFEDRFGEAVDVNDEIIAVASMHYRNIGCVYILNVNSPYDTLAILIPSDGEIDSKFGCSLSVHEDTIVVGAKGHDSNRGAVYVFEKPLTGWKSMTETAMLTVSGLGTWDLLGCSVAAYDNTIVVGSEGDDGNTGSVYVFTKNSGNWTSQSTALKLTASDRGSSDYFGCSVDIYEDYIVVGAYGNYLTSFNNGAAYLFKKPVSGWANMTETARFTASSVQQYHNFGMSVAISDSIVVVGAPGDNSGGTYFSNGAVYVYKQPPTGWVNMTETAKLTPAVGKHYNLFGQKVDIQDSIVLTVTDGYDYGSMGGAAYIFKQPSSGWSNANENAKLTFSTSGWGYCGKVHSNTVVIGNIYDDSNGKQSGAIYVYKKPVSGWETTTETSKVLPIPYHSNAYDHYGAGVVMNDRFIIIGQKDSHKAFKGKVYVLSAIEPFDTIATLTASDATSGLNFGCSVDIYDSIIVVGAFGDNNSQGAVYVFKEPENGWCAMTETAKLTASTRINFSYFGYSVRIFENTIVVGMDMNSTNPGKAYVYEKPAGGWEDATETAILTASDEINFNKFGISVGIEGDYIVVGAKGDKVNGNGNSGSVYLFQKPEGGWITTTETAKLTSSTPLVNAYLGSSVDIEGNTVVAGAYTDGIFGAVYVFTMPEGGWTNTTETAKLVGDDFLSPDYYYFGKSICVQDDVVVVGSEYNDENGTRSGAAYIFNKPATGWIDMTENQKLIAVDGKAEEYFGCSVSKFGDKLIIGAKGDDDLGFESGSAYIFNNSCTSISTLIVNACDSLVSPSGKYTWINSGVYTDTIPNHAACDSIITVTLTVGRTSYDTISEQRCGTYVSPSGNFYFSTGIYSDTLANHTGCDSIITINLVVDTVDVRVGLSGTTLTALATDATFQWVYCDDQFTPIEGATNNIFTPLTSGTYAVVVGQGDCLDISDCFDIVVEDNPDAITGRYNRPVIIYPNPTNGEFTIDFREKIEQLHVVVTNLTGQIVEEYKEDKCEKFRCNLDAPEGIYMVNVFSGSNQYTRFQIVKY